MLAGPRGIIGGGGLGLWSGASRRRLLLAVVGHLATQRSVVFGDAQPPVTGAVTDGVSSELMDGKDDVTGAGVGYPGPGGVSGYGRAQRVQRPGAEILCQNRGVIGVGKIRRGGCCRIGCEPRLRCLRGAAGVRQCCYRACLPSAANVMRGIPRQVQLLARPRPGRWMAGQRAAVYHTRALPTEAKHPGVRPSPEGRRSPTRSSLAGPVVPPIAAHGLTRVHIGLIAGPPARGRLSLLELAACLVGGSQIRAEGHVIVPLSWPKTASQAPWPGAARRASRLALWAEQEALLVTCLSG